MAFAEEGVMADIGRTKQFLSLCLYVECLQLLARAKEDPICSEKFTTKICFFFRFLGKLLCLEFEALSVNKWEPHAIIRKYHRAR